MEPPWSLRMDDGTPLGLVAVLTGTVWVESPGGATREVPAGSVAVARGRDPVTLSSEPGLAPQVVCGPGGRRTDPDGTDLADRLRLGTRTWGNDPDGSTVLLLGCYHLRGEISGRVVEALPALLVLEPSTWSSPLVPLLAEEIGRDELGQQAVLDRLLDLLLVSVVRAWFARQGAEVPGWYAASLHPVAGPALRLL